MLFRSSDGRDSQLSEASADLDRVVSEARTWNIPVYMLRTAYNRREGDVLQDPIWRRTVERTGGRFYAAYDDDSINRALNEIDRLASVPRPDNGRRHSLLVHPDAYRLGAGPGLAPTVRVTLEVLNPGEQSAPFRHNADRKSTRLNSSHMSESRMPSSA